MAVALLIELFNDLLSFLVVPEFLKGDVKKVLEGDNVSAETVEQCLWVYLVEHYKIFGAWHRLVEHIWIKGEHYVVFTEERALLEVVHVVVVDIVGGYLTGFDEVKWFKVVVRLHDHLGGFVDLTVERRENLVYNFLIHYLMRVINIIVEE